MNQQRRNEIAKLKDQLEEIAGNVSGLMDDEQEYFDNMPESFQQGEKGQTAESAIDALQSAVDSIEEAMSSLEEACG